MPVFVLVDVPPGPMAITDDQRGGRGEADGSGDAEERGAADGAGAA